MRKVYLLCFLVLFSGCGGCFKTIPPGYVGIVVNQWGSQRGVQDFTLRTGYVAYNPFTETVLEYPTFVRTVVWTRSKDEGHPYNEEITFSNADQLLISADISLAYHLKPEKVPAFYVRYRSDNLDGFTHGLLRNLAREKFDNHAGKYRIEQIMGDNSEFLKKVRDDLQAALEPDGIVIDQFGFVGYPRPPQGVINAINNKVQAVQDAQAAENKVRQIEAQAKQRVAEAKGEADANRELTSSLSDKLIEWKKLEITQAAVARWDGKRPMVEGSGQGLL